MLVQRGDLRIRKLEEKDQPLLLKWLTNPLVLEFYEGRDNPFNLEKVKKAFYPLEDDEVRCIIEFKEHDIGYIQFYPLDDGTKKEYGY